MNKLIIGFLMMCCANAQGNECVILLHGLARSSASMEKLQAALIRGGYSVVNYQYPSRKKNIATALETNRFKFNVTYLMEPI